MLVPGEPVHREIRGGRRISCGALLDTKKETVMTGLQKAVSQGNL